MKWGLLGVRLGILGVYIVIIVIILMSFLPLAMGGLDITMDEEEGQWEMRDGVIILAQALGVYNGGFYDIEDFTLRFVLEDAHGNTISDSFHRPVDIFAGETTDINFLIRIDLDDMNEDTRIDLVFNGADLTALVDVQTFYMMRLIQMGVNVTEDFWWDPIIADFGIRSSGINYQWNGTAIDLIVPYFVDASDMLSGQVANLQCSLRNETGELAMTAESVALQGYTSGELLFPLDDAASQDLLINSQTLRFEMLVEFEGAESSTTIDYYWYAPGGWWA